jgi:hypothetical protein
MNIQIAPRLRIPIDKSASWFIKTTKSPDLDGPIKRQFWPWPHANCVLSRVRNGLFFTNRYFCSGERGEIVVSCGDGRRLVFIEINHSQGVCFNMRDLVGISSTAQVESYINLSLAATSADRNFVYMAWCRRPTECGGILLETRGEPTTLRNGQASFDMRRLLAWDPRVEFRLDELVGVADIVMTHPHARARWSCEDDSVILSADDSEGEHFVKRVIRQAVSVVVPGF